jgi:hypothetical protein
VPSHRCMRVCAQAYRCALSPPHRIRSRLTTRPPPLAPRRSAAGVATSSASASPDGGVRERGRRNAHAHPPPLFPVPTEALPPRVEHVLAANGGSAVEVVSKVPP